jgi:hypothetical protein
MAETENVERRLAALEQEVAELKRRIPGAGKPDWRQRVAGSFKDEPEFDEVLRLGREIRQADRPNGES